MEEHVRTNSIHFMRLRSSLMCSDSVNIVKVLGEGGFSFVYLAQDEASGVRRLYH